MASKVLRPGGSTPASTTKPRGSFDPGEPPAAVRPAVVRPASAGGDENLAGTPLEQVAREYRKLEDDLDVAEKEVDALKKKMAVREEILIEQMLAAGMQNLNILGRCLYLRSDLVVSKGKGVSTERLIETLHDSGFGDLVSDSYSAQSLKATIKEARERAAEAAKTAEGFDPTGEAYYCRHCMTFNPLDVEPTTCYCRGAEHPAEMIRTINGVPAELSAILYQQEKTKLGSLKV